MSKTEEKRRTVIVAAGQVTTKDGKTHKQDAAVSLPDVEARDLVRAGLAREASVVAEPQTTKKEG